MASDDIDDLIAERFDAGMAVHVEAEAHLTPAEVRVIVEEVLAERGGDNGPPPPPPPPVEGRRIPSLRLIAEVDPADVTTFGPGMTKGQRWAGGDMIQARERRSFIIDRLPLAHRTGYGRTMDDEGNIDAWPMANGRVRRYGAFTDAGGRWFTLASQFRGSDGYHPAANRWFNLIDGQPQEVLPYRGWRVNTAIDRRDGYSDPVTFDSAKSSLSAIGADTPIGPGAPIVTYGLGFRVAPWMFGTHSIAGPVSLHEPGSRYSGPIACTFHRGNIRFWSKRSVVGGAIDYDADNAMENHVIGDVALPPAGTVVDLVIRLRPDRTGQSSLLEVLWVNAAGKLISLLHKTDPYGYLFTNVDLNKRFYPMLEVHPWHEWNAPASGRVPVWNWDPTTPDGPCVYLDVRRFFVATNVTPDEAAMDLIYFRHRG